MRRRYEDVSNLVQYQLKTNQQGDIEFMLMTGLLET